MQVAPPPVLESSVQGPGHGGNMTGGLQTGVHRERGVVLIIIYKFVKGGLWLVLASTIVVAMHLGLGHHLLGVADHLRLHAHPWSLHLADLVVKASGPRTLRTIAVALVADGSVTLLEGWALYHGHWWGPWLVVVATGSLLPFEILALVRHPHAIRAVLFALNLAIVWYLARTALRERELRRLEPPAPGSATPPRGASPPA